ncbi:glycosyltransferase [uncultured Croceicoccus sp.]|uniref:glycosyltransferase n=1 Tax=uncultured Croceicoccus sp. TaxID=1295329 RepID=UPI0026054FDA|nr:glycosyltransferase [uncultured Croceicoccus sp.]
MTGGPRRAVGYFVHHQGRGHAERAAAIANRLIDCRPVTLFCARSDIFPELDPRIERIAIPSLFEPEGTAPPRLDAMPTPDTLHCAPVGWPTITRAVAAITAWFDDAAPALFMTDVSAELGQLARIASVPHVAVLQHGDRADPGHMASYAAATGLLAPYHPDLEQPERPRWMQAKTHYAPGVGVDMTALPTRDAARERLSLSQDAEIVLVLAGGGGTGTPTAPLTLGARDNAGAQWFTIGTIASEWHETPPGNLRHMGWVDNPQDWIAAADRIVSSCGNTTVQMVCAAGKPWIVVPEWRYFDEQLRKADALERAGVAAVAPHWPAHAGRWRALWDAARAIHPERQRAMVRDDAAEQAARWLDHLATDLWAGAGVPLRERQDCA